MVVGSEWKDAIVTNYKKYLEAFYTQEIEILDMKKEMDRLSTINNNLTNFREKSENEKDEEYIKAMSQNSLLQKQSQKKSKQMTLLKEK